MSDQPGIRIGLDIGGTALKAVRIDADDSIRARVTRIAGGGLGRDAMLDRVTSTVRELAADAPVARVGIAVGGMVRADGSMPRTATNLPALAEVPLATLFGERLGAPVTVMNDAQAGLHGEAWRGAARGLSDVLLVTLGTGIGGAVMLGSRVRRGAHGSAGEIGAWRLTGDQTLEEVAAPAPFEARIGRRLGDALMEDPPTVAARAAIDHLARALAAAHQLLDLEAIILVGGITAIGEPLRIAVEHATRHHCAPPLWHGLNIVIGALGPYAGAIGALAPSTLDGA